MKTKQRLYQISLNLLKIGEEVSMLEKHFNKKGGHRCITVNPSLELTNRLYLTDSDFKKKPEDIISQIEINLDEIKDLLGSIETNIVHEVAK